MALEPRTEDTITGSIKTIVKANRSDLAAVRFGSVLGCDGSARYSAGVFDLR